MPGDDVGDFLTVAGEGGAQVRGHGQVAGLAVAPGQGVVGDLAQHHESLGVSQPTVSRAVSTITPLIPEATREFVPAADDLDPDAQYILDGTLLPCWSWDGHKELYSGSTRPPG